MGWWTGVLTADGQMCRRSGGLMDGCATDQRCRGSDHPSVRCDKGQVCRGSGVPRSGHPRVWWAEGQVCRGSGGLADQIKKFGVRKLCCLRKK